MEEVDAILAEFEDAAALRPVIEGFVQAGLLERNAEGKVNGEQARKLLKLVRTKAAVDDWNSAYEQLSRVTKSTIRIEDFVPAKPRRPTICGRQLPSSDWVGAAAAIVAAFAASAAALIAYCQIQNAIDVMQAENRYKVQSEIIKANSAFNAASAAVDTKVALNAWRSLDDQLDIADQLAGAGGLDKGQWGNLKDRVCRYILANHPKPDVGTKPPDRTCEAMKNAPWIAGNCYQTKDETFPTSSWSELCPKQVPQ